MREYPLLIENRWAEGLFNCLLQTNVIVHQLQNLLGKIFNNYARTQMFHLPIKARLLGNLGILILRQAY